MTFSFTPGNALGCVVNAHRSNWDGSICTNPADWDCSADLDFRRDFCSHEIPRCYHHRLFKAKDPWFEIDDNGAGWILQASPKAFDDQILLLWAQAAAEPGGIRSVMPRQDRVAGLYRIQRVDRVSVGHRSVWRVVPHPGGWVRLSQFGLPIPRFENTGGVYIRQIDRTKVVQIFEEVAERSDDSAIAWTGAEERERFDTIRGELGSWFDAAREASARNLPPAPSFTGGSRPVATVGPALKSPLAALRDVKVASSPPPPRAKVIRKADDVPARAPAELGVPAPVDAAPVAPPAPAAPGTPSPLIEPSRYTWIESQYGTETLNALIIASLTKPFIILSGSPGVGKSHLALGLVEDPLRTCVVCVSATWRGREDALGYVNPLSNEFEPTELTSFLFQAADAWRNGDRRPFLVVFEEFNLSQPEHWLSDILVVSQYKDEAKRRIALGGKAVRGRSTSDTTVGLSPAVRFVATINRDHTSRALSPRVIDRSAVVELGLTPKAALARAGVKLDPEHEDAIADLDFVLRPKAVSFSIRSAESLQHALPHAPSLGLDAWQVVDLVLVQEVLSKVQLMARDPRDESLLKALEDWARKPGRRLNRCSLTIASWRDRLNAALDVGSA